MGCRNDVSQVLTGFTVYVYSRLDFRRLPGPVFDPPRRETAGRVTRWPCLWRNWKIDNLGVSDINWKWNRSPIFLFIWLKIASSAPLPTQMTFEIAFSVHFSIHCEKYSPLHFCTRRHVVNFLWSSNIGCVFCGSELTDSWKRTKLNGKVSDLPDRISNVLNVPLSNINVDGYI